MKNTRDLIGLNVFSVHEGRILGRLAECVVDLASGTVLGLIVELKPGEETGIARKDITAVGRDAVMVSSAEVLKPLADLPALAKHRTGGKTVPQVLTKSGQVLGTLGLVHVDEAVQKVVSYEIAGDLMQAIADGPATMKVLKGTVHGADAIVLPDSAVAAIERPGGLRSRFEKAVGVMRQTATEVGGRMTTAAGKVRSATEAATETAVKRARAAAEVVEDRATQVGGKMTTAAGKVKSATEAATGTAVKRAKAAAEVVEDRAGDAVKAVKERMAEPPAKPVAKKAPAKAAPKPKAAPKKRAALKKPAKA